MAAIGGLEPQTIRAQRWAIGIDCAIDRFVGSNPELTIRRQRIPGPQLQKGLDAGLGRSRRDCDPNAGGMGYLRTETATGRVTSGIVGAIFAKWRAFRAMCFDNRTGCGRHPEGVQAVL
jgi:hypothetical protein